MCFDFISIWPGVLVKIELSRNIYPVGTKEFRVNRDMEGETDGQS